MHRLLIFRFPKARAGQGRGDRRGAGGPVLRRRDPAGRRGAGRRTRGLTLIEMVVAILVLSIGTVAAFRSIDHARVGIGGERDRLFAGQVALNRAAELQILGAGPGRDLTREVRFGPVLWQVATQEKVTESGLVEIAITVSAEGRPGARRVVYVPSEVAP